MNDELYHQIILYVEKIAPTWPLNTAVAVNPFFGLREWKFKDAAIKLKYRGGFNMFMSFSFYLDQIKKNYISIDDIENAFLKYPEYYTDYNTFIYELQQLTKK